MSQSASNRRKNAIAFATLPPEMATALRQIIRRVRTIIILRGLLATLAVALLAIMTVMAIDATTVILSQTIRILLSGAILVVTLITAIRRLALPLARPFTPVRMARLIERRRPELEERLSTVVEILSGGTQLIGSERLFAKLMETACGDIRQFRPEQEFTMRTVKPRLIAAGVAFTVLFALLVAFPRPAGRLFLRAIAPHAQVGNFYAGLLQIEPGDTHLLRNQSIEIIATTSPQLQSHPVIRRSITGKTRDESVERMHLSDTRTDGSRVYRHLVPAANESFAYRVVAGFSVSRQYQVSVFDAPALDHLQLEIIHPPYTGRKTVVLTNNFHNLTALVGSKLNWTASYNRQPIEGGLRLGGVSLNAHSSPNGASWSTTLSPGPARNWSIRLKDAYGYTNTPASYTLTTRQDAPPQVQIAHPEARRIELPPYASLALTGVFVDDFSIVNPTLEWATNDAPYSASQPIANLAPTADSQTWIANTSIDLGRISLENVKQLRIRLSAEDNLPAYLGGPQSGHSDEIIIILNRAAQSAAAQTAAKVNETIQHALEEIKRGLKDATKQAETADQKAESDEAASKKALDTAQQRLAELETRAREIAEATQDSLHAPVANKLEELAESQLEAAKRQAETAQLAEPESSKEEIAELKNKLLEAVEAVQELSEESKIFADELGKLIDLDTLARREEALAQKARQADDAPALETLRKEQEALRREMKQTIPHEPEAFKEMLEKQQKELQAASDDSRALAETQEQLRQHMQALESPDLRAAATQAIADMAQTNTQEPVPETIEKTDTSAEPVPSPEATAHALQNDLAQQTQELAEKTRELHESLQDWGQAAKEPTRLAEQGSHQAEQAAKKAEEASRKSEDPPLLAPADKKALHQAAKQQTEAAIEAEHALQQARQHATKAEDKAAKTATAATEAQEEATQAGEALRELLATAQTEADTQAETDAEHAKAEAEVQTEADAEQTEADAEQAKADAQAQADATTQAKAEADAIDAAQTRAEEAQHQAQEAETAAQNAETAKQLAAEALQAAEEKAEETKARAKEAARRMADAKEAASQVADHEKTASQGADEKEAPPEPTVASRREDPSHDQKGAQEALTQAAKTFEKAAEAMQPLLEQLTKAIEAKKAEKDAKNAEKEAKNEKPLPDTDPTLGEDPTQGATKADISTPKQPSTAPEAITETTDTLAPDQTREDSNLKAENLIEAEAAMFDAADTWEKLNELMAFEQNAEATAKAQQEALRHQQTAEEAGKPEAIQQAQEQTGQQQKQAIDALKRLTEQLAQLDLPENVTDSWEEARQAQAAANQQQQDADAAQRQAKRAQQQAEQTRQQATSLQQQAAQNQASEDQARETAEKATAFEADAHAQSKAAQDAQIEARAEQQRAAERQNIAHLATRAERTEKRSEHRTQAADAAQAAAEAMRREARDRAEQLAIAPESLAAHLAAPPPESESEKADQKDASPSANAKPSNASKDMTVPPVAEFLDVEVNPLSPEGRRSLLPAWFRLRGSPRAGADHDRWQDVPAEYRPLVQDYFRKLSEEHNNE